MHAAVLPLPKIKSRDRTLKSVLSSLGLGACLKVPEEREMQKGGNVLSSTEILAKAEKETLTCLSETILSVHHFLLPI